MDKLHETPLFYPFKEGYFDRSSESGPEEDLSTILRRFLDGMKYAKTHCSECNRKLTLSQQHRYCLCGATFCDRHFPETRKRDRETGHDCPVDWQRVARQRLEKAAQRRFKGPPSALSDPSDNMAF